MSLQKVEKIELSAVNLQQGPVANPHPRTKGNEDAFVYENHKEDETAKAKYPLFFLPATSRTSTKK